MAYNIEVPVIFITVKKMLGQRKKRKESRWELPRNVCWHISAEEEWFQFFSRCFVITIRYRSHPEEMSKMSGLTRDLKYLGKKPAKDGPIFFLILHVVSRSWMFSSPQVSKSLVFFPAIFKQLSNYLPEVV